MLTIGAPQFISLDQFGGLRNLVAGRTLNDWVVRRSSQDIMIGVSWPFAVNQDGMDDGVRLGQEEINARGGVDGRRIELVMRDDGMDEDRARNIALEFSHTP